jgi:hypothetical protein
VESVWANEKPVWTNVVDQDTAGDALTSLASAAFDILAYRRLTNSAKTIRLVSSEVSNYLSYLVADNASAVHAVNLSHMLAVNGDEAILFAAITGQRPPSRAFRVHIIVTEDDAVLGSGVVRRLDLDPRGDCRVSWYGPFLPELFQEIATGFALFTTHLVATVFDDDDGSETFHESIEYLIGAA